MSEVAGPSQWKVKGEPMWASGHETWWCKPNIDAIARVYEKAYERGPAYQSKQKAARPHAMNYAVDRVQDEYWVPVLKELEARCS
jgi:hypothetical protein